MAKPRAVIDVVMAKALADHFLEQIRFFVGTFSRPKARNGRAALVRFEVQHALCCEVERLVP